MARLENLLRRAARADRGARVVFAAQAQAVEVAPMAWAHFFLARPRIHIYRIYGLVSVPLITVRVDDETKAKMDRIEGINWSKILREHIREVLERESRKNRIEALRIMEKLSTKSPPGWDSTAFIRRMRDTRYGPGHRRR